MSARRAFPARVAGGRGEPRVYSVRELVAELRNALESDYSVVVVQGEITDCRRSHQEHWYFRLKDVEAQIQVVFFATKARLSNALIQNGVAVQVEGSITVYGPRGDLQLVAERVAPVGYGALQARFEALKKRLQAEGLFAEERKRPLPRHPTRIGLVTSLTGAAIRDVLTILRRRAPYATVTVAPVRVQGAGAAEEIAGGIRLMNEWGGADVIIVGRGGGSLEDLWAFNEEAVVRAIAASRIPVISAVGHEVDVTLSDLAADVRAATPTHAAQQAAVDKNEICRALADMTKHARARLLRDLTRDRRHLQGIRTHRAFRVPHRRVGDGLQSLDQARDRLGRALSGWVTVRSRALDRAAERLRAHAPLRTLARFRDRIAGMRHRAAQAAAARMGAARVSLQNRAGLLGSYDYRGVLRRGYALVWSEDGRRLVNRAASLRPDQPIRVQFQDARAHARVTRVEPAPEEESG